MLHFLLSNMGSAHSTTPNYEYLSSHAEGGSGRDSPQNTVHTQRTHVTRQLGCHKSCCGGFCLRVGAEQCCAHATTMTATTASSNDNNTERYCSFCEDRRRDEGRALEMLEQRRLQPTSTRSLISAATSRQEAQSAAPPQLGIPKACCGQECSALSYTHCCEHGDRRFHAPDGLYPPRIGGDLLVPRYEYYCRHCYDKCRERERNGSEVSIQWRPPEREEGDDNESVGAVRIQPKAQRPSPRRLAPTNNNSNTEQSITHKLMQLEDPELQECIQRCLTSIECPVCLESYSDDSCTLPCGHSICLTHIYSVNSCPICRHTVDPNWKALAQPSIALRESSKAVKEAIAMMVNRAVSTTEPSPRKQQHSAIVNMGPVDVDLLSSSGSSSSVDDDDDDNSETTNKTNNTTTRIPSQDTLPSPPTKRRDDNGNNTSTTTTSGTSSSSCFTCDSPNLEASQHAAEDDKEEEATDTSPSSGLRITAEC